MSAGHPRKVAEVALPCIRAALLAAAVTDLADDPDARSLLGTYGLRRQRDNSLGPGALRGTWAKGRLEMDFVPFAR